MNELPIFVALPIIIGVFIFSVFSIMRPMKIIQIIYRWPLALKRFFNIKFPAGGDDALAMAYKDVSNYELRYRGQLNVVQLMGFIGITITTLVICNWLS